MHKRALELAQIAHEKGYFKILKKVQYIGLVLPQEGEPDMKLVDQLMSETKITSFFKVL